MEREDSSSDLEDARYRLSRREGPTHSQNVGIPNTTGNLRSNRSVIFTIPDQPVTTPYTATGLAPGVWGGPQPPQRTTPTSTSQNRSSETMTGARNTYDPEHPEYVKPIQGRTNNEVHSSWANSDHRREKTRDRSRSRGRRPYHRSRSTPRGENRDWSPRRRESKSPERRGHRARSTTREPAQILALDQIIDRQSSRICELQSALQTAENEILGLQEQLAQKNSQINQLIEETGSLRTQILETQANYPTVESTTFPSNGQATKPGSSWETNSYEIGSHEEQRIHLNEMWENMNRSRNTGVINLKNAVETYKEKLNESQRQVQEKIKEKANLELKVQILTLEKELAAKEARETGPPITTEMKLTWEIYRTKLEEDHKKLKEILEAWEAAGQQFHKDDIHPKTTLERFQLYNRLAARLQRVDKLARIIQEGGRIEELERYTESTLPTQLADETKLPPAPPLSPPPSITDEEFHNVFISLCKQMHFRALAKEEELQSREQTRNVATHSLGNRQPDPIISGQLSATQQNNTAHSMPIFNPLYDMRVVDEI